MCEVMMPDGKNPAATNKRATILANDAGTWFGFEQEILPGYKDGRPARLSENGFPAPQGPYYTGVGFQENVGNVARQIDRRTS